VNDTSLDPEPLVAIAEEFLDRLRRGECPSLSEYAQAYPELADRIHDLFPALVELERLGPAPPSGRRRSVTSSRSGSATIRSCARSGEAAWASFTKRSRRPWAAAWH